MAGSPRHVQTGSDPHGVDSGRARRDNVLMSTKLVFPDDVRPDFPGFSKKAFTFLRGLKKNNDRAWFNPRKETYETECKFAMECLIGEFSPARGRKGLVVQGDPKAGVFRIYRDVRFAKNKQPYKPHVGAVLSRTGKRGEPGVVYIQIAPGNSFTSAGFWGPSGPVLTAWRNEMTADPEGWMDIVDDYSDVDPDKPGQAYMRAISTLSTMPRGFKEHADGPVADYLKWKSFLLTRKITDAEAQSTDLVDIIDDHAKRAAPLLQYGWRFTDTPADDDPRKHMRKRDT